MPIKLIRTATTHPQMSDLVAHLADLITHDNAILLVGDSWQKGTELVSLVQQIADALAHRIGYSEEDRTLPAVSAAFQALKSRNELIFAIREELEKQPSEGISSYQLLADAVLPQTKLITTRFDDAIEEALRRQKKPFVRIVRDTDLSRFDESQVALVKIYGDIENPESLVITEDDVDAFLDRLPTISDVIRAFFATKTLIFLGYELENPLFKRLYRQAIRKLSLFQRPAYAIVPIALPLTQEIYWEKQNVQVEVTDPHQFLSQLAQEIRQQAGSAASHSHPLAKWVHPARPDYPYKGLQSYTSADTTIFMSRAEESQQLTNRILGHRLCVVYGESGSGKTSLLQAGVMPRLAENRALLAMATPVAGQSLIVTLREAVKRAGISANLAPSSDTGLLVMLRDWQYALGGPIVLAVDQFEQFFLTQTPTEQQASLNFLQELLADHTLNVRLVIIVREDFLGRLQTLQPFIPGLLDVRYRLERLGREEAQAAIEEPARLFEVHWQPELVQMLLDELLESAGISAPQLQLICDRLYRETTHDGHKLITLALYEQLGGAKVLLGDYVEQVVKQFPEEERPQVYQLLGVLVNSAGIKRRLSLSDIARAAQISSEFAQPILETLTNHRLLQRFETVQPPPSISYELTHDYLAPRIIRHLSESFWQTQKAREILRQSLPEWQKRGRLLAADDLHLIEAERERLTVEPRERELLYATAVAYNGQVAEWAKGLETEKCRHILLQLSQHPQPTIRQQIATYLTVFSDTETTHRLCQLTQDENPAVQQTAIEAIAAAVHTPSIMQLALSANQQTLVAIRDLSPATDGTLPAALRHPIQRQVWQRRWRRHRPQVLADTLRGLQMGFWGFALGWGPLLGLNGALAADLSWEFLGQNPALFVGFLLTLTPYAGIIGASASGAAAFVGSILRRIADRPQPLRIHWVMTLVAALTMGVVTTLIFWIFAEVSESAQTILSGTLLGAWLGGWLVSTAVAPLSLPRRTHLLVTVSAGIFAFYSAWYLGLLQNEILFAPLIIGATAGLFFFFGLNPINQSPQ